MSNKNSFYAPENYQANVQRAWHNLSEKNSFTPHTGLNYPVFFRMCYSGDEFRVNSGTLLQTILPLNRPLLDCFELRLEYYFEPLRNLYGYMSNNSKESAEDIAMNSPKWQLALFGENDNDGTFGVLGSGASTDFYIRPDNAISEDGISDYMNLVHSNSLAEHFNIPVGWQGSINTETSVADGILPDNGYFAGQTLYTGRYRDLGNIVNFEPWLVYLDIMRTYHVNTQLPTVLYSEGFDGNVINRTGYDINDVFYKDLTVSQLDDLFISLRYHSRHRDFDSLITRNMSDFRSILSRWAQRSCMPSGGFFPVQYKPDLWRNLLSSSNSLTSYITPRIQTEGGSPTFSIEEFRKQNKIQRFYDAIALSGGRFSNLLRTVFGWRSDLDLDIPILKHVTRHIIDPSNITALATTQTSEGETILGQKGANVDRYNSGNKEVVIRCDEPGYIMVVASITPIVNYSQGFSPFMLRLSHNDDWNPNFSNLGFQNIPKIFYSAYPDVEDANNYGDATSVSGLDFHRVVGKNLAWVEEITSVGRVHGEFNEWNGKFSDMVLGRKYTNGWYRYEYDDPDEPATDSYYSQAFYLDTYVNPLAYNDIFAVSNILESPWSLHCAFGVKALRPIGKHYRPNLE